MYQGQYTFNTSHAYFNVSAYLFPKNMCNIMIFITAATNHNLFLIKLKYVLDQSVSISPRDHLDWRVVWSNYLLSIVWRGPAAISVFHFRMINISESVSCIQTFSPVYIAVKQAFQTETEAVISLSSTCWSAAALIADMTRKSTTRT